MIELEGEDPISVDRYEFGRSYTVGADGVVTLGSPFVFDRSNIDNFKF